MNNQIREFQDKIIDHINSSPLPLEIKRLSLHEVYNMVQAASDNAIRQEKEELTKEQKKTEEVSENGN